MQLNWPQTTDHLRKAVDGLCLGINHNGVQGIIVARDAAELTELLTLVRLKDHVGKFTAVRIILLDEVGRAVPSAPPVSVPIAPPENPAS